MALPLITPQMLREWNACYTDRRILSLFDGREALTPLEILALKIPSADRVWVVLRVEVLPEQALFELACRFAETVAPIFERARPGDTRVRDHLAAARCRYRGELSHDELFAHSETLRLAHLRRTSWPPLPVGGWHAAAVTARCAGHRDARDAAQEAYANARCALIQSGESRDAADSRLEGVLRELLIQQERGDGGVATQDAERGCGASG